jgi:hypothetical protein
MEGSFCILVCLNTAGKANMFPTISNKSIIIEAISQQDKSNRIVTSYHIIHSRIDASIPHQHSSKLKLFNRPLRCALGGAASLVTFSYSLLHDILKSMT